MWRPEADADRPFVAQAMAYLERGLAESLLEDEG
jgi:hypothetical protein